MALLEIDALSVAFGEARQASVVVDRIGFAVDAGETVALVGESGSGKSVTALAVMGLLQEPGRIVGGQVRFAGRDLVQLRERELAKLRGDRIAMIFQEPMSSLNPLLSVGAHVMEPLRLHRRLSRRDARAEAIRLLDRVGIPSAAQRADDYPHRLSGGMRQRVMIAAALACRPALLIADEPTTALDVTIQAQIMDLLSDLQAEFGMGILFITHDLGVVAEHAHRVVVLYAGRVAERAETARLFAAAAHPYTVALLDCIPDAEGSERLAVIEGSVPAPTAMPPGCRFAPRCPRAVDGCRSGEPGMTEIAPGHAVACIHPVDRGADDKVAA